MRELRGPVGQWGRSHDHWYAAMEAPGNTFAREVCLTGAIYTQGGPQAKYAWPFSYLTDCAEQSSALASEEQIRARMRSTTGPSFAWGHGSLQ